MIVLEVTTCRVPGYTLIVDNNFLATFKGKNDSIAITGSILIVCLCTQVHLRMVHTYYFSNFTHE